MALDGDIKLPVVGEVNKKYALIGGAVALGIVTVVIIRKRNAASTAASTTATGTSATDTTGTSGIDPQTGYPYGSAEDQALLQGTAYPYDNTGYGGSTLLGPNSPVTTPTETKEEWLSQAETDLSAPSLGFIGPKIFAGLSVTAAEKDLFLEAVALEGAPPGGYPTPIKVLDTKGHPGPGSGGGHTGIEVPSVTGRPGEVATDELQAAGFRVHQVPATTPHGKATTVTSQSPAAGRKEKKGTTVTIHVRAA